MTISRESGQKGRWFSGPNRYSTKAPRIFLSLGGYRDLDGFCIGRGRTAFYWTCRHGGSENTIWNLFLTTDDVEVQPMAWPHDAYLVRCVRDVPGKMMH